MDTPHMDTEKKTPVFRASSWSQAGFLVMVECVDSSSVILSVTPVEEVSSRNPGCEVKQVPNGVRMGTWEDITGWRCQRTFTKFHM